MSMIFGTVEIPDVSDMPPATTGDEIRVEEVADPESEAETDEEILEVAEEASYEGTEEAMVDADVQASLADTPLASPIAAVVPSEVTPGTDAQVQMDAPGTES
uniref:Polyprotein protein n=1 Tax=Solanum tuberosum TaxID=4113 RepID=M1DSK0_SOLTU